MTSYRIFRRPFAGRKRIRSNTADAGSNSAPKKTNALPTISAAAQKPAYHADSAMFAAATARHAFVNGTGSTPSEIEIRTEAKVIYAPESDSQC